MSTVDIIYRRCLKGLCKVNKLKIILGNFVSGWVGPGLTTKKNNWKIFPNSPLLVLIFWGTTPYVSYIQAVFAIISC